MSHTPGPWKLGGYDEHLGYDCMTGGIRAGPVVLDGHDYGQENCAPIATEALARMIADARLISAAPDLLEALRGLLWLAEPHFSDKTQLEQIAFCRAAIAKATEPHQPDCSERNHGM